MNTREGCRPESLPAGRIRLFQVQHLPLPQGWEPWLRLMGLPAPRMTRTLRFLRYSEAVEAAVAGHGVVIGRMPLLADLVRAKKLVAPFRGAAASSRGYFVTLSPQASHDANARAFADWLVVQARSEQPRTRGRA